MKGADSDSQDKNLVASLDQFAKMASLRDSDDSILTHVYPYMYKPATKLLQENNFYSHCITDGFYLVID